MASQDHPVPDFNNESNDNLQQKMSTTTTTTTVATATSKSERDHLALVLKNEEIANVFAMNNISFRQKIPLKHQFFILSLLEYTCNLLNVNDKSAADSQFKGGNLFFDFFCILRGIYGFFGGYQFCV
jgi:hypothetical protein